MRLRTVALTLLLIGACAHPKLTIMERVQRTILRMADAAAKQPPIQRFELVNTRDFATCYIASVDAIAELPDVTEPDGEFTSRTWAHVRDLKSLRDQVRDLALVMQQVRDCLEKVASVM